MISTRDLLEPIFMRTFYVGVIAPFLFAYLGSSNVLAPFVEQAQWLVSGLALIWPTLPTQYERVLEVRGVGHAASYGFLCAALWVWPAICAVAFLREHARRRQQVLPISPKEAGQFIVVFPFAILFLLFDQTKIANSLTGFQPDRWGFFYLRQWFVFGLIALVLAVLIYVVGRNILSWVRR
jgi:hypothetical protein